MKPIEFFVPGIPVAKGSARSFYIKKTGKTVTVQDNKDRQRPWASIISYAAQEKGVQMIAGPVEIVLVFAMPRPKSHYGTGKNKDSLKENAPLWHTVTPDLDKLIRCVLDALTGIVWKDDKQVVSIRAGKLYNCRPGVNIEIKEI